MRTALANPVPLLLLLGLVASASWAKAGQGIADAGKFFSADAIRSAEEAINAIQVAHQKDLRIDTIDRIPNELLPEYRQQGKQQFFEKWTNARAVKQGIDGVYILICRDPGHLQVWVSNDTARRLFTAGDRDFVVHKLLTRFRQHEYDPGLLDAVHFVRRQMDDRSKATEDPNQPLVSLPLRRSTRPERSLLVGSASADGIAPASGTIPSDNGYPTRRPRFHRGEQSSPRTSLLRANPPPCHPERSEGPLPRVTQSAPRSFASAQDDNSEAPAHGGALAILPHPNPLGGSRQFPSLLPAGEGMNTSFAPTSLGDQS
jgi:uncharacterized membrane protein YgcG